MAAIITGASTGLGREYARLFARDGEELVLVARNEERLRELAADLAKDGRVSVKIVAADLSDPGAPQRIAAAVEGTEIDCLVNNAGSGAFGAFAGLSLRQQLDMIALNVASLTALTHLFLPGMLARRRGRVLNVASTAGFQPGPNMAVYYATKAYVVSFSEAIAHELRGSGVTVTCHCPGATATEFFGRAGGEKSLLFRLKAADAASVAEHGYRAMRRGEVLSIPGLTNRLGVQALRLAPRWLVRRVAALANAAE